MDWLELYFKLKAIGLMVCFGFAILCTAILTIGDLLTKKEKEADDEG